ncbi:MAG: hypothetical protein GOVbin631_31 [Prokaryotic dsDNA virus sp.]|nr:MAG: hypothetical protein GOVbin631_31 [Prokaryotic dsDNA virus sp.]|tara:strand:+ start:729 stop:980 length:252 start_codon:yes stop_codon:yes gene_type:complete
MERKVDGLERVSRRLDRTIERIDALVDGGKIESDGVSLRDYFAAKALNGMCSYCGSYGMNNDPQTMSNRSYEIADAMMEARGK